MKTIIAQITDTHIRAPGKLAYGRLDTAPYLEAAVQCVQRLRQTPSAVLLTGDLTDFGRPQEYAHLRHLLAPLRMPYFLMPGNHDDRAQLRASFPEHAYLGAEGFVQYSVNLGAIRVLALDTTEPGESAGRLCAARLRWLERELSSQPRSPTVVAMHHPPFKTMIGHMDRIGLLEGAAELEAIVASHPQVERIVCGHLHRTIYRRFGGTIASTAPSPAHQVCLDLDPDARSEWNLEPPGIHLHAWSQDEGLVTHVAAIGSYAGPHPFHADDGALID
ncbi:MAG TPA: phosphodiesterase [Variovorax sp.]|nr:phosphodiesterase [Variovorax sp.]